MAQSYHQKLYPQLYTADGILKSSLIPTADSNGSGTGVDSLNLAGSNGKGNSGGISTLWLGIILQKKKKTIGACFKNFLKNMT